MFLSVEPGRCWLRFNLKAFGHVSLFGAGFGLFGHVSLFGVRSLHWARGPKTKLCDQIDSQEIHGKLTGEITEKFTGKFT